MRKSIGFTLLELTIALSLMVLFLGLVVVRLSFGSDRQHAVNAARRIGKLIETYREKAAAGECLYAIKFDAEDGILAVFTPAERNVASLLVLQPIKSIELNSSLQFSKVLMQGRELPKPAIIFLDGKNLLLDMSIEITSSQGAVVVLHPDPLINIVRYEER